MEEQGIKVEVRQKSEDCKKTRDVLLTIYDDLYHAFGPQHWWPADTTIEMIIGAILVQNVSWHNTKKALTNLKEKGLLNIEGLLKVDNEKLEELIRATRYYKTKAKKIKAFVNLVDEKYQGKLECLLSLPVLELRKVLLNVYGIGEETADAIILYGSHKPIFVIDAYTKRIFNRLGYFPDKIKYCDMQQFFMKHLSSGKLKEDVYLFNEYHALLDCLAKNICLKSKPKCDECPLNYGRCKNEPGSEFNCTICS